MCVQYVENLQKTVFWPAVVGVPGIVLITNDVWRRLFGLS